MILYLWPYPGSVLRQRQYLKFQRVPFASSAWMLPLRAWSPSRAHTRSTASVSASGEIVGNHFPLHFSYTALRFIWCSLDVQCAATPRPCVRRTRLPPTLLVPPPSPLPTHPHPHSRLVRTVVPPPAYGYASFAETSAAGGTAVPMPMHTTSARRICMRWSSRRSACGTTPATATYIGSSRTKPMASWSNFLLRRCVPSTTAAWGVPARRTPSPQRRSRRSESNIPIS